MKGYGKWQENRREYVYHSDVCAFFNAPSPETVLNECNCVISPTNDIHFGYNIHFENECAVFVLFCTFSS